MNENTFAPISIAAWSGEFQEIVELDGEVDFKVDDYGYPLRPDGFMDIQYNCLI